MRNWARKTVTKQARDTGTGSGSDATVSDGALADEFHVLWSIVCGYYGAPTAGSLKVEFGGVIKWQVDLPTAGPFRVKFPRGLYTGTKNEAMVVTLADGQEGKDLNITYS